jgi:hypothetical protein
MKISPADVVFINEHYNRNREKEAETIKAMFGKKGK